MDILNPERGQKLALFGQTWSQRSQKAIINDKKIKIIFCRTFARE